MNARLTVLSVILLSLAVPVSSHRLDEYLQATIFSIEQNHVEALVRLIPGVAVSSAVLASIDTNADNIISETEQRAYAERVLHNLSLTIDGRRLKPRLTSVNFPGMQEMREGFGEIQIEFRADLPSGGADRRLVFENQHQSPIAVYLVNCLVPRDRNIRIVAQNRNKNQSFYQLDYVQADSRSDRLSSNGRPTIGAWLGTVTLLLLATLVLLLHRIKLRVSRQGFYGSLR